MTHCSMVTNKDVLVGWGVSTLAQPNQVSLHSLTDIGRSDVKAQLHHQGAAQREWERDK